MSSQGEPGGLGRKIPSDWEHVEKYPLSALPVAEQPTAVPVVLGINWYQSFDEPVWDASGYWWIGKDTQNLGELRGGHCVCARGQQLDSPTWYPFYDQGKEGACVGFAGSRMMSLLNRKRYFAKWLWDQAKLVDEWTETQPGDDEGTSVRAGMDVLAKVGHVPWLPSYEKITTWEERARLEGVPTDGIAVYRWAQSMEEVLRVIQVPVAVKRGAVPILNSWGRDYPHTVWMPLETLDRLRGEAGEIAIVTDR